jgi:predicted negative regulator of RcsB-dependent stress response
MGVNRSNVSIKNINGMKVPEVLVIVVLLVVVFLLGYRIGCGRQADSSTTMVADLQEQSAMLSKRARDAYKAYAASPQASSDTAHQ